jgi:voltage-gated potassium channel
VTLKDRLPTAFALSAQIARSRGARLLRASSWFPHVPLAMLVGATGLLQILLTSGSLKRLLAARGHSVVSLAGGLGVPVIRGAPQEAIGGLLILVGVGLLWRSRLAWVIAFLLSFATVSLEFSPLSTASRPLEVFSVLLLLLLLASRRCFTRVSLTTATLFALVGVLVTLGYGVIGSYVLGSGFNPKITNFIDAVYFTIITMATVGYGDITPHTAEARLFTISLVVLGIAVFATSLPAIVAPFVDKRMMNLLQPRRRKKMKRASHVIVVGDGPLAQDAARALTARGLQTTSVLADKPDPAADPPEDFIVGDGSDTETLRRVHAAEARAVLALSEDDSYNAFVVLAVKELNPNVRTVAAVSNTRNTGRVARTRPDVLLTLPQLGSELLAMALSGEEIKADALISQLLKLG